MVICRRKVLRAFAAVIACPLAARERTDTDQPRNGWQRIRRLEEQEIIIPDFDAEGFVLDLGGGGAGVIGRLKATQVITIDLGKDAFAGVPPGPLKLIMDTRDLKFLDHSFPTVTSFFTLMCVPQADRERVFQEVFRVLLPGGRFLVWDAGPPPLPYYASLARRTGFQVAVRRCGGRTFYLELRKS